MEPLGLEDFRRPQLGTEHEHTRIDPSGMNDEVLEKGNRDMKRFRDMTWWGGDSSKEAQAAPVKQTRYRLVRSARDGMEAVYAPYEVEVAHNEASWVVCMKLQVAADILASRRPHQLEVDNAAKRQAAKRKRDEKRDSVKAESVASLATQLLPPPVTSVPVPRSTAPVPPS